MIQIFDKSGKLKSSGIPGFGTVTNVSASGLSSLFNVTVNNPTTTPTFSFSKINQPQKLFYASPNSGTGAPSFRSIQTSDLPSLSGLYVPVSRNITINGITQDLSTDRSWTIAVSSAWGSITGTLSSQTDLQNALDDKVNLDFSSYSGATTPVSATDLILISQGGVVKKIQVSDVAANNIRRNAQYSNVNYSGYAPFGSLESDPVWTITKITVALDGTVTTIVYNNVTWTSVPI